MVVDQSFDTAPGGACHDRLADAQGPPLHDDRRDRAAADVQVRLEDDTSRIDFGVGGQLEHLGEHDELFQQLVDAEGLKGRDLDGDRVATPGLRHEALLGQLLHHTIGICVRPVDLVDGRHDRHFRGLGVVDRLHRLRHHTVVGGHHEHDDVSHAGPAGAHRREGFVTGCVDESQQLTAPFHLVGTDVLGYSARLACDHVRIADPVEQKRLAVVDVAHDSYDGRSCLQVLLVFFKVLASEELRPEGGLLLLARVDQTDLRTYLRGEQADHVVGERLGGGDHLALEQEEAHDVTGRPVEARAELLWRGTALDDHLVVGNGGTRRQVGSHLDRLELLHVASATARPALGGTSAPDGTTSCCTGGTTGRVATTARAGGSAASVCSASRACAVSGWEVTGRARKTGARSRTRAHLPAGRRTSADGARTRRARPRARAHGTGT